MQRFTPRGLITIIVLTVLVLVMTVVALNPAWKARIKSLVISDERQILAKTSAYLSTEGPFVSVFKVREGSKIFLEVFSSADGQAQPKLLQKIPLSPGQDGYFNFQGNATNLAISDADNDGVMDILAPTFDDQMTPRLNVYRYNPAMQVFELARPPEETH